MTAPLDDWTITFRPLPQEKGEPDAVQRMRRLLKTALRQYGFRAVDYRWAKPVPLEEFLAEKDPCPSD